PHALGNATRDLGMSGGARRVAPPVQLNAGSSAIIDPPVFGSAITRWMSESSPMTFAATRRAATRYTVRSTVPPREDSPPGRAGSRRSASIVVACTRSSLTPRPAGSASVFTGQRFALQLVAVEAPSLRFQFG